MAFAVFGICSLALGWVILPLVHRLSRDRHTAELRAQRLIHLAYRFFVWLMTVLGLIRVTHLGTECLRAGAPRLIVANHPSLIDTPLLMALLPQADSIVDVSWAENPFVRDAIVAAGYIRNDGGREVVDECARRLRAGRRLVVFPEGTRSPVDGLGPFRRGAAHIALASGCALVPVVITSEPATLKRGQKWYDVPDRRVRITIRVAAPLAPADYLDGTESRGVAARKVTFALREFFRKELRYADP